MRGGGFSRQPWVDDLAAGETVGEYRVDEQIGEGGMGRVYSATHPVIAKRVAIKVLDAELSTETELVERFIEEARSVNRIGHPNIVDIFSFGTLPDGRYYYVMELLRGESMGQRLRRGPLGLDEALPILEAVIAALSAAHEKGIVHRDLKPDNVFLVAVASGPGSPAQVKLLDFGIAKLVARDDGAIERTRTGNVMGSPPYMSPEQARGHKVDERTDVYSLGCVAYEMFSGSRVFPASNPADMVAQHLMTPPPSLARSNPQIPRELDALVQAMLAKHPDQRPSLAQVSDVLGRVAAQGSATVPHHGEPVAATPAARRSRRGVAVVAAVLTAAVVVALAVGISQIVGSGQDEETAPAVTAEPEAAQPPVAQPVTVEPPVAQPVTVEPPAAQPPAAQPPAAQPVTDEPPADEPPAAQPSAAPDKTRTRPARKRTPRVPTKWPAGAPAPRPLPPVMDDDAPL